MRKITILRKQTTIRIDSEILKKAQELGINVSKACENCLKNLIEAMEKAYPQKQPSFLGEASLEKKVQCGGWDLNPRTPTGQAPEACAFGHARRPPPANENGV